MKKFLFALLGLVFAAPFAMADNIKMVTYFPVPYASYGDLSVSGTCDVGLLNTCSLDAGEKLNVYKLSSDGRVLNTGSLIANSGKLDLNSSASSSQINTTSLVSHNPGGQTASTGVLEFSHDLTVDTIKGASIQSAEATNRADMDALYLFGSSHRFPTCDGTGHKMSWQKLTVDGKSGVFLVCGAGEKVERKACSSTCPSGYIRNPDVQYEDEGDCCIEKPTVYYFRCTGVSRMPASSKYNSWDAAKEACESGRDPGATYALGTTQSGNKAPAAYQQCGTPENEAYIAGKTRFISDVLQATVTTPIDPGDLNLLQYIQYSCTTECADCSTGGIGGFSECRCTYGVG